MNSLSIHLDEGSRYETGRTVSGEMQWHLENRPRKLRVSLFWYTEGKGNQDVEVVERMDLREPESVGSVRFSFPIPVQGPYSFSGKLISLCWAVEAVSRRPNLTRRTEIVVGPRGEEVRLPAIP